MKRKQQSPTYEEKGVRYMMCQKGCCYISVGEQAKAVTCYYQIHKTLNKMFPEKTKPISTGRPAGWHFMAVFVDKDGKVFHKGIEQPKLKGTMSPTKVKPRKKIKRRSKEQILIDRHKAKQAALKKLNK